MKLVEVSSEVTVRGDWFVERTVVLAPESPQRNAEIDEAIRAAGHSDGFWKGLFLAGALALIAVWIFR